MGTYINTVFPDRFAQALSYSGFSLVQFSLSSPPVYIPRENRRGQEVPSTPEEIRTLTVLILSQMPPANWATGAYKIDVCQELQPRSGIYRTLLPRTWDEVRVSPV